MAAVDYFLRTKMEIRTMGSTLISRDAVVRPRSVFHQRVPSDALGHSAAIVNARSDGRNGLPVFQTIAFVSAPKNVAAIFSLSLNSSVSAKVFRCAR